MISPVKLYGLVLSGGKSTRMGTDKGLITYHNGIPQREYLYHLLEEVCDSTFMSVREEQVPELPSDLQYILDEDIFKGPFNGILSAHRKYPDVTWLVLACDLPLLNIAALKELIAARNAVCFATAFAQKENPLPEPLCAIWEPAALAAAIPYLEAGIQRSIDETSLDMSPERYSRQTILKDFGSEAQQKLLVAKVLVVGAGGLGVPVLTYLNAMGVGTLGIVDADTISLTNLHRQVLYDEVEIGDSKAKVASMKLKAQNPATELIIHDCFLTVENALSIVGEYDLIVDATDNFPARYLINDACTILKKPFVYGALHGFEGQVSVFNFHGGPTYRCLFPKMPSANEVPDCNEHGVLGVIPGIIGNLQALEAVK
ncbi:unnamed protein product, partial [Cyprideis torosa]